MAKDNSTVETDGLTLRGNRASKGFRAHVSVSNTETGQLVGRVFGTDVADAWEKAPAQLDAYKAKIQEKEDTSAAEEEARCKAEDDARAAAIAKLNKKTPVKKAEETTTNTDEVK